MTIELKFDDYTVAAGILAHALALRENDEYMDVLVNEMLSCIKTLIMKIHNSSSYYCEEKHNAINDCKLTINKDIGHVNDETCKYGNTLDFINSNKQNNEGIAKLKSLLNNVFIITRNASEENIIDEILHKRNNIIISNNYDLLCEFNLYVNYIQSACTFMGSFTEYEYKQYIINNVRSLKLIYDLLYDAVTLLDSDYDQ